MVQNNTTIKKKNTAARVMVVTFIFNWLSLRFPYISKYIVYKTIDEF